MKNKKFRARFILSLAMIAAVAVSFIPMDSSAASTKSISKCKITTAYSTYYYTGSKIKPTVTVKYKGNKLKKDRDYKLTYSKTKYPGTATVKVTGKGDYSGTVKKTYAIKVAPVKNLKAEFVGSPEVDKTSYFVLTWDKQKACSYFKVTVKKDGQPFGEESYKTNECKFTLTDLGSKGKFDFTVKAYGGGTVKKASAGKTVTVYAGRVAQEINTASSQYEQTIGMESFNLDASAKTKLSYKSSKTSVAAVDDEGNVTPMSPGTAEITIKAEASDVYNEAAKTVTVTVKNLQKPVAKAAAYSCRRNVISWEKVPGASGYMIYELKKSTGIVTTYDMKGGDTLFRDCVNKSVDVEYVYNVQAYTEVNDKVFNSPESSTVSCKAKGSYIGHAMSDRGHTAAGDQDGREVTTSKWTYSSSDSWKHWGYVIRFNDPAKAEKVAKCMEDACRNDNIGYDHTKKPDLKDLAPKAGYDLSKVTTKCETDCNCLVAVCVNCVVGSEKAKTYATWSKSVNSIIAADDFTVYTSKEYVSSDKYLRRGDILMTNCSHTHACIVL